ncbi:MAG: hypothetical protein DRJ64_01195 [Thermoprotei archaeon]|nr:MAG: hypothetical protein DRJ64_01195 [Thermoprotei archaeon]
MTKVAIVISDMHLHFWEHYNQDGDRISTTLEFLEGIFKKAERSDVPILFAGDLFHTPEGLKSPTINAVYPELIKLFYRYPSVHFYAISGNHDQYTKNYLNKPSISYVGGLANSIKNFHLLDMSGYTFKNGLSIYGIPYLYLNTDIDLALMEATNFFVKQPSLNILLMHTTITGSTDTNGYEVREASISKTALEGIADLTLVGHIHKHQKMAKGVYHIGSSVHVKVSDEGYTPVYLDIYMTGSSLKVVTKEVTPVKIFKTYTDVKEKDDSPNTMWVHKIAKDDTSQRVDDEPTDIQDLEALMKSYLKTLEVKDKKIKAAAYDILEKTTQHDTSL